MLHKKKFLFVCLTLCFSIGISVIQSQEAVNLLANGGFEDGFTSQSGDQPRQVADGWTAWHVPPTDEMPSFQNAAPKYQPVAPDSSRVRSGSDAQVYFSFFETHEGGVYQQVDDVTDGAEYRFSIYAHIWSSTFEDVDVSEDPGDVALRVGIDPTGGTDGTSDDIVWSTPAIFYDTYRQYAVIATAESDTITVFVESTIGSPVQNSYIYLDDAVLEPTEEVEEPAEEPTATDVPEEQPTDDPTPTAEDTGGDLPSATPVPPTLVPTATPVQSNTGNTGTDRPISEDFPGTIVHTVRRGDTVSALSVLYGSSTQAIIQANGLNDSALIFVGQGLLIPVRIPDPATVTPTSTDTVIIVTATQAAAPIPTPNDTYVVQVGDTLNQISARFNTTVGAIVQLNGIANPNRIFSGQVLRIPVAGGNTGGPVVTAVPTSPPQFVPTPTVPAPVAQQTYTVVPGDTLYRLALRFGVDITVLAQRNNISNYNFIFVGQVLTIPR